MKRLVGAVEKAAKEQRAEMDADSAVQMLTEQAVGTYIENAVAMEEWDLRGLEKWAEAAEISLPISQWQRVGEESEEEGDSLSSQLNAVREQIQERLKRAIRNRPPADMIARIATREFERQIEKLSAEPEGDLSTALSWLDRALGVSLPQATADGGHRRGARADRERPRAAARRKVVRQVARRTACASAPTTWSRRSCRWTWPPRSGTSPACATRSPANTASRLDPFDLSKLGSPADRRDGDPENPRSLRAPRDGTRRRAHAPDRALPAPPEV